MANTTYATLAELKERVSIASSDTGSDTLLQQVLNTAAYLVDRYTRGAREGYEAFSETASLVRYFADEGTGYVGLDDATSVTAVATGVTAATPGGTALASSDWAADPWQGTAYVPIQGLFLSTRCASRLAVTGTWGYCTAANRPAVVKEATLLQAALTVQGIGHTPKPNQFDVVLPAVATLLTSLVRRPYVV